jgi:hypothetical protein
MTIESLTASLTYARRQKSFAWAKYYEQVNTSLHADHAHYHSYTSIISEVSDTAIPEHIKTELKDMAVALRKKWECPICMDMIGDGNLEISNCGHFYCKPCIARLKETHRGEGKPKWECAVCRRKHGYGGDE